MNVARRSSNAETVIYDGPSLETYVETRFNIIRDEGLERWAAQEKAVSERVAAFQAALAASRELQLVVTAAADLRYQQRFEAQSDALNAAFLSQQTAMQTAFTVAEKAVQAALAAADRAVAKAEGAADKRFDALNELRQMLNDMMTSLMPRKETEERFSSITEKIEMNSTRVGEIDKRINTAAGEKTGARETKDDSKALWAVAIAVGSVLLNVVMKFIP